MKYLAIVLCWLFPTHILAAEIFEDKNERFVASIPNGWSCRDEGETARSKIICLTPAGGQNYIRFLVAAGSNSSFDDFVREQRSKIPDLQKRIRGSSFAVEVRSFGGNQAVLLTSNVGLELASIIRDGWVYNVNFSYSSAGNGRKYREDFHNVVASLIPLATRSSGRDADAGFVERQRRLAELYLSLGQVEDARIAIQEGLEVSRDDPKLLELKSKLED